MARPNINMSGIANWSGLTMDQAKNIERAQGAARKVAQLEEELRRAEQKARSMGPTMPGFTGGRDMAKEAVKLARQRLQQAKAEAAQLTPEPEQDRPSLQYLDADDYALPPLESFQNPELLLGPSAMEGAVADPESLAAQQSALAQLAQWSTGDVTEADRAMYDAQNMQSRLQADQMARGQRDALAQQYAARGLGGSMSELAQQMSANQAQAQRYALQDAQNRANMLGNIQQRALAAVGQQGSLGSQMRGQSFGEAAQRAAAADRFNQDNMNYRRGTFGQDVTAENNRRLFNNQRRFQSDSRNRDIYNQGIQQGFQNQYNIASGMANVYGGQAATEEQRRREQERLDANRTANATGLGYGLGSYFGGGR